MQDNTRYDYSPIIHREPVRWPNGARIAVWIIPNIEHFKIDVPPRPPGLNIIPDVQNFSARDYSLRVGIWRMMEIMDKHGFRGTVALNSDVCERYPAVMEECQKRGWEFMGHGVTNSQLLAGMSEEEERATIRQVIETITRTTGQAPKGWLGPALAETFNTPDLLAEAGIQYVCDWTCDDQPFPMKVKRGRLISVPYGGELNDIRIFLGRGAPAPEFFEMVRDQFDVLYNEGARNGRVMAIALHPFLIGHPFRSKYLDQALAYIASHNDVWITTGGEIADWYYEHYYPKAMRT